MLTWRLGKGNLEKKKKQVSTKRTKNILFFTLTTTYHIFNSRFRKPNYSQMAGPKYKFPLFYVCVHRPTQGTHVLVCVCGGSIIICHQLNPSNQDHQVYVGTGNSNHQVAPSIAPNWGNHPIYLMLEQVHNSTMKVQQALLPTYVDMKHLDSILSRSMRKEVN